MQDKWAKIASQNTGQAAGPEFSSLMRSFYKQAHPDILRSGKLVLR
jgi:hypothetical protein